MELQEGRHDPGRGLAKTISAYSTSARSLLSGETGLNYVKEVLEEGAAQLWSSEPVWSLASGPLNGTMNRKAL